MPQILINRERLKNLTFDVELLGDCDGIISELARKLGSGFETLIDENCTALVVHVFCTFLIKWIISAIFDLQRL